MICKEFIVNSKSGIHTLRHHAEGIVGSSYRGNAVDRRLQILYLAFLLRLLVQ